MRSETLTYAGEVSTFEASLPGAGKGVYILRIVASDPKSANFAMHESRLELK